jgi:hypothetical protein
MSSIFVLDQTANVIDQTINTAYSGLVLAGTGLVRTSGDQNISGKKTFHGAVDFTGSPINLTGVSSFIPFSNLSTDIGSASKIFKAGFFSGLTGFTGYFQNLTVENLTTSLPVSLIGVTGSNMTLNGTTNIATGNVSGNLGVTGNLLVRGATTLSGNISFFGAVLSTGNKTFSGILNQSGDVNVYGKTFISGDSSLTGNVNITGNLFLQGDQNITGGFAHTGRHFVNSNNNEITFTGSGPNHALRISAPTYLTGAMYHAGGDLFRNGNSNSTGDISNKGDISNTGNFSNVGNFSNIGNFNLWGNAIINTGSSVIFNAHPRFNSGVSCSGNSITPSIRINPNLVSTPSGGAIEYSRGQFFATNELTGNPTRALINQIYSYIAPDNFVFPFMTGGAGIGIPFTFLGTTGIYLSTGVYDVKYSFTLTKGTTTPMPIFSLGLTGDSIQNFNYRHGLFTQRIGSSNTAADSALFSITGNASTPSLAFSGIGIAISASTPIRYELNTVINVTGSQMKIRPFIHASNGNATGNTTGINFDMTVITLSTGSGINQPTFNGPWSDS